jgi:pimeloyl-ACP methyl ester carboxylesterase
MANINPHSDCSQEARRSNSGLSFDTFGSGPPLLLLHGLGSHRGVWSPLIPRLISHRRVIAVDLPGQGRSGLLPSGVPYTVDALTSAIAAFIDELGPERPQIVGNSLGGAITLELARRGFAAAVTAIAPIGFWSPIGATYGLLALRCLRGLSTLLRPVVPQLCQSAVGRSILFGPVAGKPWRIPAADALEAYTAFVNAPAFDATLPHTRRYYFRNGHELTVPTTIVWGRRDQLLPVWQMRHARRLLPQARFVVLSGGGHVPMADDPVRLAELILAHG